MPMFLKITDGTTTIDLLGGDSTNSFNLLAGEWAPNVARRKRGQLGGNWVDDVVEALPLYAQSDTDAATVLANLETLAALLDQAQRWGRGEAVAAVRIQYSPNSSTAYLEAAILGPPDGEPGVVLPETFSDDLWQKVVDGVVLQFKRRGLWLGDEATQASSATADPGKMTATFPNDTAISSPVDVKLAVDGTPGVAGATTSGFLIFSDDATDILVLEAEAATKNNFVTHADAGASGGNVAQMNTGVTSATLTWTSFTINSAARMFYMFALVKLNGTDDFDCRGQMIPSGQVFGKFENISLVGPHPYFMGIWITPETPNQIRFEVAADAAVTSGNEIEIDYVVVVAARPNTTILGVSDFSTFSTLYHEETHIQHRLLTNPKPTYYQFNGTKNLYNTYNGSPIITMSSAALTAVMMLAGTGIWSTEENHILTATRRPAYLVPR